MYVLVGGDQIKITKGLKVEWGDSVAFNASNINLIGGDYVNHFEIHADNHSYKFDDDLRVFMLDNRLEFINDVDLDHYVAGVVEAEAGYNLPLEYYKLQAILCRTYALKNLSRHQHEGFNLCDKVHCQVYHHKCGVNDVVKSTASTSGLVVVDHDLELINTSTYLRRNNSQNFGGNLPMVDNSADLLAENWKSDSAANSVSNSASNLASNAASNPKTCK